MIAFVTFMCAANTATLFFLYMIERDLVEAIVALPNNMFYNTDIGTFIWVLSNRKEHHRRGKIQLIDATTLKPPLRKNLGQKNCELTPELREQIIKLLLTKPRKGNPNYDRPHTRLL